MKRIVTLIKSGILRLGQIIKLDIAYVMKGGVWLAFGNSGSLLLSFLLSIAYANFLSKDVFGNYKYIQSIASVLVAFTLTGMNTAVVQAVARGFEGTLRKSIIAQLKWSLLYIAACLAVGSVYLWRGNYQLGISLMAISLLTPITLTFNTYIAFLNGKKDFKAISKYNLLTTTFIAVVTVATMFLTQNVVTLVIANAGAAALANLVVYLIVIKSYKPNETSDPQALSFGKHLSLMGVFGTISSQVDSILIFHFLGPVELSIFTFAVIIPDRLKSFTKILSNLALPKYSQKTSEELRHGIRAKLPLLLLMLVICAGLYALLAPIFYHIFFPKYQASISLTQIYSLALITSAATLPVAALFAQRSKKKLYIYSSGMGLFQIIASGILIPWLGLSGAIAGRLLSLFFGLPLALWLLYRQKSPPSIKPDNLIENNQSYEYN